MWTLLCHAIFPGAPAVSFFPPTQIRKPRSRTLAAGHRHSIAPDTLSRTQSRPVGSCGSCYRKSDYSEALNYGLSLRRLDHIPQGPGVPPIPWGHGRRRRRDHQVTRVQRVRDQVQGGGCPVVECAWRPQRCAAGAGDVPTGVQWAELGCRTTQYSPCNSQLHWTHSPCNSQWCATRHVYVTWRTFVIACRCCERTSTVRWRRRSIVVELQCSCDLTDGDELRHARKQRVYSSAATAKDLLVSACMLDTIVRITTHQL